MNLPLPQGHDLLTNSRLQCAKTCGRKHYFRYEIGVRRGGDEYRTALRRGTAIHKGLELLAAGHQPTAEMLGIKLDHEGAMIAAMLAGYAAHWQCERQQIARWLAVELPFDLPITNPATGRKGKYRKAGKIDGIAELVDGRVVIVEHKTAKDDLDPGSPYWQRLTIDSQISMYWLAAKELGYDIQGVLYDVLRTPAQLVSQVPLLDSNGVPIVLDANGDRVFKKDGTPRQTGSTADGYVLQVRMETPEEYGRRIAADISSRPQHYYHRREIPRLASDIDEFAVELWEQSQQLQHNRRKGWWPRNSSACVQYQSPCEYLSICANGIEPENPPSGFQRVTSVHPELEAA